MITIDPIRRIDDQSIIRYARKFTLPLPEPFIEANDIKPRDEMLIYRERVNGVDALIIIPKKKLVENQDNFERTDDNSEIEFVSDSQKTKVFGT